MFTKLKNRKEGFTIIEVLIVLAIAGLIMLIVFLAVPTLQRNARNTQRNHDASLVAAAAVECLNNHNGLATSCNTPALLAIYTTTLSQLTNITVAVGGAGVFNAGEAHVILNENCNAAGDNVGAGTNRSVAVTFVNQTGTGTANRCISS